MNHFSRYSKSSHDQLQYLLYEHNLECKSSLGQQLPKILIFYLLLLLLKYRKNIIWSTLGIFLIEPWAPIGLKYLKFAIRHSLFWILNKSEKFSLLSLDLAYGLIGYWIIFQSVFPLEKSYIPALKIIGVQLYSAICLRRLIDPYICSQYSIGALNDSIDFNPANVLQSNDFLLIIETSNILIKSISLISVQLKLFQFEKLILLIFILSIT